jgi:exopolysaccharide biosynthesis polyprenyl glycosylphosphotransferase
MSRERANRLRDTVAPLALLFGDTLVTFGGLSLGYWLRYDSPIGRLGIDVPGATYAMYLPLLLMGVTLLIAVFAQLGLYDTRLILRRYQSLNIILKGSAFWLACYLGVSLVLRFDPPISRLFVVIAFVCVVVLLYAWRNLIYAIISRTTMVSRLRRRTLLLGWNPEAKKLVEAIAQDSAHPFRLIGIVTLYHEIERTIWPHQHVPILGSVSRLNELLPEHAVDLLIITRLDMPRPELQRIVEICERAYVEWKIIPDGFDIFLSGLHLQTVGSVPVLGVEELTIRRLFNRGTKRALDIVGAAVGLIVALPLILVLAALIKRESPGGPAFFAQERIGSRHRRFRMWKLRSMVPDAAATDAERQSTPRNDPRLLRVGAFMRRWNLDELPQFWNVLAGDMSLVGPRPERPVHVDRLSEEIPHYLPRHIVRPGMTGWAQVNGLRGDSDLTARVQHDIFYIENWSIWLDVQIILLTFVRWKNAY